MTIPQELIEELHANLNSALSQFNTQSICIDWEKRVPLYYGNTSSELFDNVEQYLESCVKRIYNTLKARLPPPLYPIVKLDYDDDAGFMLFICYATPSDTHYITSIDDCIQESDTFTPNLSQSIIEDIHSRFNRALSDFNTLSGCIDGNKRFILDNGCRYDRIFDSIWPYLCIWEERIYNTLKARLPPPLYPIVRVEFDEFDQPVLFICYGTPSDIPYITSIEDCLEE
jgi:hypothetical protein